MATPHYKALFCVLLSTFLFALLSPVSKLAMGEGVMTGTMLATMRLCGAAILFWILSAFNPKQQIERKDWLPIFLMSLCGMALNQFLFIIGVSLTAPTNAALATVTTPVVTVLLSRVLFKQVISWQRAAGIALAASGVVFLVLGSSKAGGPSGNPLGDMMCMGSQLLSSCYFLFFLPLVKRYQAIVLMKWLFTLSSLVSLPFVFPHLLAFPWAEITPLNIAGSAYVVVGSTFLAYLLMIYAQRHLPTTVVVSFIYLQPLIAATASISWGLEPFSSYKVIAAAMIGVGVWMVQHFTTQSKTNKPNK